MKTLKRRVQRLESVQHAHDVYAVQFSGTDRVCIWAIDGGGRGGEMTIEAFIQRYPRGQITDVVNEAMWRAL